jgi:aspartate/methionine/tyrosine aminotransferase
MEMEKTLAARSMAVEWSGIRVMLALADEITGVMNLGIGQPDFDTPAFIREAAKKALDEGYTRYPPAKGFKDLRGNLRPLPILVDGLVLKQEKLKQA